MGSTFLAAADGGGLVRAEEELAAAADGGGLVRAEEELAASSDGGGLVPNNVDNMVSEVSLRFLCVQAGSPTSGLKRKSSSKTMKRVSSSKRGSVPKFTKMFWRQIVLQQSLGTE